MNSTRINYLSVGSLLLTLCLHLPLPAQVIIKDTVIISPAKGVNLQGNPLLPVTDIFFRAPRSGALAIMLSNAYKVRSPLPTDAYLAIQLSDTTYTPEVLPYLPYQDSSFMTLFDSCRFFDAYIFRYCAIQSCQNFSQTAIDTFYTRSLQPGDTVRFSFHAQYISPTILIENPAPNRWRVHMYKQFCNYSPESCYLSFFFADTLVKFITPDTNVYPTYPNRNDSLAKKNWMDIELRVEYADSGIPNFWVRVDTPVVVDSGGHSHSHTSPRRPVGRFNYPTTSSVAKDTLFAQTDNTGKLRFRYVASQFGGRERITARLASDTTKFDTLSLITRVPGLQLLPDGTNHDLVGGTCKHHGPDDDAPIACQTPDNNHYAAQIVRDSLPLMANVWVDSLGNLRLFVNDISLPYGGLFDHKGTWAAPHSTHREGLDVDIRTELLTLTPPRQGVKIRNEENELVGNTEFEELAKRFGVRLPDIHEDNTNNEHYHLYNRSP